MDRNKRYQQVFSVVKSLVSGTVPGIVISAFSEIAAAYYMQNGAKKYSYILSNFFMGIHFTSIYEFVMPLLSNYDMFSGDDLKSEMKRNVASTIVHEIHASYDFLLYNYIYEKEVGVYGFAKPVIKNGIMLSCKIQIVVEKKYQIIFCNILGEVSSKLIESFFVEDKNVNYIHLGFMGVYKAYHADLDSFFGEYMERPFNFYINGVIRSFVQDLSKIFLNDFFKQVDIVSNELSSAEVCVEEKIAAYSFFDLNKKDMCYE